MRGIFVTGTDTDIGKTIVSAALVNVLRESESVCYWKPIQTGIEEDDDTKTVRELADCADSEIHDKGIRLKKSLSPHLSARLAGFEITIEKTLNFVNQDESNRGFWIVEGAGGVCVPLNEKDLMVDLMERLNLPAIVVARSGLGTINHTLLTLESIRSRGLDVLGVVLNGEPNLENRKAIELYGKVRVLAEMPIFEKLTFETLRDWSSGNLNL